MAHQAPSPSTQVYQQIESEILSGLRNETDRLDTARTSIQVYLQKYTDPEVTYYDREQRARRDLPLMSKVIGTLTAYAYQDPPTRTIAGQGEATKVLERIYEQNKITVILRASDAYRHASDLFAVQVHATGKPDKPIKIYSWTADCLVVWCDPDDQTEPIAVCTIDRYDNQTRYRLWTSTECRTYLTRKIMPDQTAGGRVPTLVDVTPHDYGIIPFVFFHLFEPITQFVEGGIGATLALMERHINFRLMENADHLRFSKPRGFLMGVDAGKELLKRPRAGEWDKFAPKPQDARGNVENPHVEWVGPPLDWVDKEWDDLRYYWGLMLESVGVPAASIPLDKVVIANESGAAIIARNIQLFLYAKKTQEQYRSYEQELAKTVLTVLDREKYAQAIDTPLTISFGEVIPDMPPDSPDDYLDGLQKRGELSEIQVVMKRQNLTREQALEHLEQVAKDQEELEKIRSKYKVAPPGAEPLATDENVEETKIDDKESE